MVEIGCKEKSVHHLLINLLANHHPEDLLKYLKRYDGAHLPYDVDYALKLTVEKGSRDAIAPID